MLILFLQLEFVHTCDSHNVSIYLLLSNYISTVRNTANRKCWDCMGVYLPRRVLGQAMTWLAEGYQQEAGTCQSTCGGSEMQCPEGKNRHLMMTSTLTKPMLDGALVDSMVYCRNVMHLQRSAVQPLKEA